MAEAARGCGLCELVRYRKKNLVLETSIEII